MQDFILKIEIFIAIYILYNEVKRMPDIKSSNISDAINVYTGETDKAILTNKKGKIDSNLTTSGADLLINGKIAANVFPTGIISTTETVDGNTKETTIETNSKEIINSNGETEINYSASYLLTYINI